MVAVSGGVDSVVLLDLLIKSVEDPKQSLVVAHFDHGIRKVSSDDRKFVENLASKYGLEFFYKEGHLGPDASEALARAKRYEFLNDVKTRSGARAIVTAHHQGDLLETVVINVIRGTGRKGLSSLAERSELKRPLLKFSKKQILEYARSNGLKWHEDETNQDTKYLRNYIRHNLIAKLTESQKKELLEISRQSQARNKQIDELIYAMFEQAGISRSLFAGLSHALSLEITAAWLRRAGLRLDRKTIERLTIKLKTAEENKLIQASGGRYFVIQKGMIRLNGNGPV